MSLHETGSTNARSLLAVAVPAKIFETRLEIYTVFRDSCNAGQRMPSGSTGCGPVHIGRTMNRGVLGRWRRPTRTLAGPRH